MKPDLSFFVMKNEIVDASQVSVMFRKIIARATSTVWEQSRKTLGIKMLRFTFGANELIGICSGCY